MNKNTHSSHLSRLIVFFETLSPETVNEVPKLYAPSAYFKDPFNEVNQVEAIHSIFKRMFEQVENPRFVIKTAIESETHAFLTWDFLYEMRQFNKGQTQCCRGCTHLNFSDRGTVVYHRDYWDPAEEVYEKIPALGALMRWLKRQAK